MPGEARLVETEHGLVPEGDGWFVVNARDARWFHTDELGSATTFEGAARFPQLGINVDVLQPGQPTCMYHAEDAQENFLVLSGESSWSKARSGGSGPGTSSTARRGRST